ncbi:MAG: glycosyltransferase [Methanolobus sp.]
MDRTNKDEVMVSICCITYNHANFVADALDGFLMQETDFKYEILIHDDASTDGTADVIRSYEEKYPDLVKPIYQTENQYSKGKKIIATFMYPKAKGKYIAFCEGDDYWTDPKKLQIQFDYMEKHPEVVCCYHVDYLLEGDVLTKKSRVPAEFQRSYSSMEMMSGQTYISPVTMFYRKLDILMNYPPEAPFIKNGDTYLISMLGQHGSGAFLPNIKPAVYRIHKGGMWSKKSNSHRKAMALNSWFWLAEYYSRIGNEKVEDEYRRRYIIGAMATVPFMRLVRIFAKSLLDYLLCPFNSLKKKYFCKDKPVLESMKI